MCTVSETIIIIIKGQAGFTRIEKKKRKNDAVRNQRFYVKIHISHLFDYDQATRIRLKKKREKK